jgi:hypothetical protein
MVRHLRSMPPFSVVFSVRNFGYCNWDDVPKTISDTQWGSRKSFTSLAYETCEFHHVHRLQKEDLNDSFHYTSYL